MTARSDAVHAAIRERARRLRGRRTARVLVVVDEPCRSPALCAAIRRRAARGPVEALVLAPAYGSAETQWYADADAARAEATRRLRGCVSCLDAAGIRAGGRLGGPDPVRAIADALRSFAADEVLLVTAPQRPSRWLRPGSIDRVRSSVGLPVRHLVAGPPAAAAEEAGT